MSRNIKIKNVIISVAIVDLGERLPLNLNILAEKLNSLQHSFAFEVVQPITADLIGEPDIKYEWHELEKLYQLLYDHPIIFKYDYMIGITHLKITLGKEIADLPKIDYFSDGDFKKVNVISVNDSLLKYFIPSKDIYQYVASCIMGGLLCNIAKEDIFHLSAKYCLFDECDDRSNIKHILDRGQICTECLAKLKKANISNIIIEDTYRVLKWCSRDSWKYSIMLAAKNPITILALGIGFGWLSRAFIEPSYYLLMIFINFILVPLIVYLIIRYKN